MVQSVLFVCTGNSCRSPMADAYLKHLAKDLPLKVASAGSTAFDGAPASSQSIEVMANKGIDLSGHQAQLLTTELIEQFDLIVPMTHAHRNRVLDLAPQSHVRLLGSYLSEPAVDIADPFGGSVEEYEQCLAMMTKAVELLFKEIQNS